MASNLLRMASNLLAMASNPIRMVSNLLAMAITKGLQRPRRDWTLKFCRTNSLGRTNGQKKGLLRARTILLPGFIVPCWKSVKVRSTAGPEPTLYVMISTPKVQATKSSTKCVETMIYEFLVSFNFLVALIIFVHCTG